MVLNIYKAIETLKSDLSKEDLESRLARVEDVLNDGVLGEKDQILSECYRNDLVYKISQIKSKERL